MTHAEEDLDCANLFQCSKIKFLHDSFVVCEMQCGVNLDKFVEKLDPTGEFQKMSCLASPDPPQCTGTLKSSENFNKVKVEVKKHASVAAQSKK